MGRGVVGLVVRPVVGLTDAATDVLNGIRDNAVAEAFDGYFQVVEAPNPYAPRHPL